MPPPAPVEGFHNPTPEVALGVAKYIKPWELECFNLELGIGEGKAPLPRKVWSII